MTATTDGIRALGIDALYHMTDLDNLATIMREGLLSHNLAHGTGLVRSDISMADVQARRAAKRVPGQARSLHDFACLYFAPCNPMLCARRAQQHRLAILAFDPALLVRPGVVFTDGNAASGTTRFFTNPSWLAELPWAVIRDRYWHHYEDGKRIKCAEILVPDRIEPPALMQVHFLERAAAEAFHRGLSEAERARVTVFYDSPLFIRQG